MQIHETELKDAILIQLEPIADERGFFCCGFAASVFAEHGLEPHIAQANISHNHKRGTLRGMHWQTEPHAETKILRCDRGGVYDVIVDIRPDSPTYKRWQGFELTEANKRSLFVPKGFAHGFITLTDDALVTYLLSTEYAAGHTAGMRYDDPAIGIEWPIEPAVVSERDMAHPPFA